MNNSPRNKGFVYGFTLGLILALFAQLATFDKFLAFLERSSPDHIMYQVWNMGFPFPMYFGRFLTLSDGKVNFYGLIGNLIFAILFSVALGLIFKFKSMLYKIFQNKAFSIGFILGTVLFALLQLYDHIRNLCLEEELSHLSNNMHISVIWSWGLPFPMYYWGRIFLMGIIGNILIAIILSFILGLFFKFVWSKIAARKLK